MQGEEGGTRGRFLLFFFTACRLLISINLHFPTKNALNGCAIFTPPNVKHHQQPPPLMVFFTYLCVILQPFFDCRNQPRIYCHSVTLCRRPDFGLAWVLPFSQLDCLRFVVVCRPFRRRSAVCLARCHVVFSPFVVVGVTYTIISAGICQIQPPQNYAVNCKFQKIFIAAIPCATRLSAFFTWHAVKNFEKSC